MMQVALFVLWTAGVLPVTWRAFDIPSGSMVPTLSVGDEILADTQGPFVPARGMLVLFKTPANEAVYVKRVIGIGGDHVALRNGVVVLNGTPLKQAREGAAVRETMPGGTSHLIVLEAGAGAGTRVMAERVVPPGALFVLGDARDNSLDSRMPEIGFVRADRIVGVPAVRCWSEARGLVLETVR